MKEYHKINSVYKRDERGKFIIGDWSRPEFEYLKDNPWLWTEKIDGTNIRVMFSNAPDETNTPFFPDLTFGGKTDNAQIPAKLVKYLGETFTIDQMIEVFGDTDVCLYGEGYGAGIQKGGGNYSPDQKFILFDVKIGNWWLKREDVVDIANKLNIPVVEVIAGNTSLARMIEIISQEQDRPYYSYLNPDIIPEGVVGTPVIPLFARNGDRIITKIKYKDFR